MQADFRKTDDIHRLYKTIDEIWLDGFDILINKNAGIVAKIAIEDDIDLSQWHDCLNVNLHAPLLLSQLAKPRFRRHNNNHAVIIHVTSIHGEKSNEFVAAYAASKAALESLTRTMAIEWASHNIRINAIAPGVVPVERTAAAFSNQDVAQAWTNHIPLQRLGTIEAVAAATLPLITNEWTAPYCKSMEA